MSESRFYRFHQNNSGGDFLAPAIDVWVEASSADEANRIAQDNGIYFDGIDSDTDCWCCGDRWYPADEADAYAAPEDPSDFYVGFAKADGIPASIVIRKD